MTDALADGISTLLRDAIAHAPNGTVRSALDDAVTRLDGPLRVVIAGKLKAGKSTLLNALVGEELAPTDAGECTKIVTWYRDSHTSRVTAHRRDGEPVQLPFRRTDGKLDIELGALRVDEIDHLDVEWPSSQLHAHSLIDTPGIASITAEGSVRVEELLGGDDQVPRADAVVYLLRHLHASDISFLESFHDHAMVSASPINAIGVLSRADEVGSCRLDAMDTAQRVAERYNSDPRVRRLCSTVVPVAGLLAQGGPTLREDEFRTLAAIAAAPVETATDMLLTVDRFTHAPASIGIPGEVLWALLDRYGLFGVRLGERLIRTRAIVDASDLSREFVTRSGLDALRSTLTSQFTERSRLLKAWSALRALNVALGSPGWPAPERLRAEGERLATSAHELTEVRLLNQMQTGDVQVSEDLADEMARLLGAAGADARTRLGLDRAVEEADVSHAAIAAARRWRRIAEQPGRDPESRWAARTVVRTCEGIVAAHVRS